MTLLDWLVLGGTILFITAYGMWRSRHVRDLEGYFRGNNTLKWPTIGLSIMATQASAITFLSTPGQAYEDGMRFVQFYFGLPLAMIVISAVFVPRYFQLKVYTAYEYLEHRFDVRVRTLGALLFLVQRGLAAGITLYAPSIILSTILGWPLDLLIVAMGLVVILYTVSGGVQAVSQTQKQQMVIMLGGMAIAAVVVFLSLPDEVGLKGAVKLAGALDRMNPVSFEFDPSSRYNFWSGIAGGFFLALSYFGTDQSQVGRYLSGQSVTESRLGLLFNGMFKVPMQALILFTGVLVFVFYLFVQPPLFFNNAALQRAKDGAQGERLTQLEARYGEAFERQQEAATRYVAALERGEAGAGAGAEAAVAKSELKAAFASSQALKLEARQVISEALPGQEARDADYVFISFVLKYLPSGLVGLLIAVIICAAMSSTSSELSALGATTMLDLWRRLRRGRRSASDKENEGEGEDPRRDLMLSKLFTVLWGLVAIGFASFASMVDNLIQAVNIIGSIFYGTVLGLFVVAFFLRRVSATPVLVAALIAQAAVIALYFTTQLGFLWFNVVGCGLVVIISALLELARGAGAASHRA